MKFLDWFLHLFERPFRQTGLLLDSPKFIETLPRHELFVGGGGTVVDWKKLCPPFRYQGSSMWCTAFAGTAIGYIFQNKEAGSSPVFSAVELFYRSGGGVNGNYLLATANEMQKEFVLESDVPTPTPTYWDPVRCASYGLASHATGSQLAKGKPYALKSAASVLTDLPSLRNALISSPLAIAVPIGPGYWTDKAPKPTRIDSWHAVVLVDIDSENCPIIFDSLTYKQGFDGFHRLASDYPISYALSFIDLPDNWADLQAEQNQITHYDALDHYGQMRDYTAEVKVADELALASRQNPTIASLLGRQFTVAINAVVYGGYSVQDILNQFTAIRRGQPAPFDLNKKRP